MRVGLLGTGPWARSTHGPALAAHPGVEFTGVWGRRPEAAASVAALFGTRAYDDADALIADVDAVAVALPPAFQAPLAARAARAGRHLLLDKPLAATVEDARAVADAVDAAGVTSLVFFTLRFADGSARWIEEQAEAGRRTGGWFTGRADWYGAVFSAEASPYADSPWRREKGGLWDVGPHALSVLLPVLGDATEVRAARGPGDAVQLTLRHDSGASSTSLLTLTAPPPAAGVAVEFRGTPGVAAYPEGLTGSATDAMERAVDALLAGVPHPCDARFGLRVTEILAQAEAALD
ncbi:Predicted dehydrogenase [Actinacidiphila rubida]|uniref:Predicted dehydrogenase n=1 Tax=Actinacidiphila rubida TaxID=310780 RepID=A0A1H8NAS2_9ACTN|nr:Gfo/Idh/MocA family oxidoreductase [Actinacidiphila rubida]SEO26523.1 Predicted dehydrogenase [Actinacidiphila rubida]